MPTLKALSGRPPGVKVGDRVRVTTVHTGIITRIDNDSFVLETGPGRPMHHGNFHGDGEMTWEVQRPEPLVGTVVIDKNGLAWQRSNEFSADPWYAAANESDRSWDELNDDRGPLTVIYEGDGRC